MVHFVRADDLVSAMADRKQIFEFHPKKIVPAIALHKIVFVRVVAAGPLAGKTGLSVNVTCIVHKMSNLDDRI